MRSRWRPRLGEDWHLKVLGKGPRLEQLLELRAELGLQERVEFVGWADNPYPTMAASDVFVHPARFEPFGIVYTEALALGIQFVATACPGGPVDVLDHGEFGRLVPTVRARGARRCDRRDLRGWRAQADIGGARTRTGGRVRARGERPADGKPGGQRLPATHRISTHRKDPSHDDRRAGPHRDR